MNDSLQNEQRVVILKAKEKDLPSIVQIERQCFASPWTPMMLLSELRNEKSDMLSAFCDGILCGFGISTVFYDEVHILNLAVVPQFRRFGIGESLLRTLIANASQHGLRDITLEVRVTNLAAIALYRKVGFETAGIRKKYYVDNDEDACIMWYHA